MRKGRHPSEKKKKHLEPIDLKVLTDKTHLYNSIKEYKIPLKALLDFKIHKITGKFEFYVSNE